MKNGLDNKKRVAWNKGGTSWSKGLHLSEEHRRAISKGNKGRKVSKKTRLKLRKFNLGHVVSEETKLKISKYQKGKPKSQEYRKKISEAQKKLGEKHWTKRPEVREKMSQTLINKYELGLWVSPAYVHGRTSLVKMIRSMRKYRNWRIKVFQRDNYTCTDCFLKKSRNIINAHHVDSFSNIFKRFQINTLADARKCKKLWDINNGRTLCVDCHKKTHAI